MTGRPEKQRTGILSRRHRVLLLAALTATVISVTGLSATLWVKSPQQLAAEARGPAPSVLTAQVEIRVLRQTVVLRGTVGGAHTVEVTPTAAGEGSGKSILTALRAPVGTPVPAGSVLLEVSGRPFIALHGAIPAYRDLRPGARGTDIAQLQEALRSLGIDPGETDGYFGPGTKRAVAQLYERVGYDAPTTGESDATQVESARRSVLAAERAADDARQAWENARSSGDPNAVDAARTTMDRTAEDLAYARDLLSEVEQRTGPMVPLSEVVFLPDFPARLQKISGAVGAEVEAPLATLSSGQLVINSRVNPAQVGLLGQGMNVEVVSEVMGQKTSGKVTALGELVKDEQGTFGHLVTVTPDIELDPKLVGQDVRLTVEAASTGTEVLAVPVSAVFTTAEGRAAVLVRREDGTQEQVDVTAGTSGDGYVAVESDELRPGDDVVIGGGDSNRGNR